MTTPEFEFTDRYQALKMPYPDPETMCPGPCDGIGRYPMRADDPTMTDYERAQWALEEAAAPLARDKDGRFQKKDGVHMIVCGECRGTGERRTP